MKPVLWLGLIIALAAGGCAPMQFQLDNDVGDYVVFEGEIDLPVDGSAREIRYPMPFGAMPDVVTFFDDGKAVIVKQELGGFTMRLARCNSDRPTTVRWLAKGFGPRGYKTPDEAPPVTGATLRGPLQATAPGSR
jgi:hypothetical protein